MTAGAVLYNMGVKACRDLCGRICSKGSLPWGGAQANGDTEIGGLTKAVQPVE